MIIIKTVIAVKRFLTDTGTRHLSGGELTFVINGGQLKAINEDLDIVKAALEEDGFKRRNTFPIYRDTTLMAREKEEELLEAHKMVPVPTRSDAIASLKEGGHWTDNLETQELRVKRARVKMLQRILKHLTIQQNDDT
jgi:hypothetical protein